MRWCPACRHLEFVDETRMRPDGSIEVIKKIDV